MSRGVDKKSEIVPAQPHVSDMSRSWQLWWAMSSNGAYDSNPSPPIAQKCREGKVALTLKALRLKRQNGLRGISNEAGA